VKAIEQRWNADACCGFVKDIAGNIVADVSLLTTEAAMSNTTQLLAAAPDMASALLDARALLGAMGLDSTAKFHDGRPALATIDAALKKAGVI